MIHLTIYGTLSCIWNTLMYFISSYSYADTLLSIKSEASSQGQDYLSWNDIQNCIDMVNMQIQEENESK